MIRKAIALACAAAALLLTACNTIEGAGKDVERGGEKIQHRRHDQRARERADHQHQLLLPRRRADEITGFQIL